MIRTEGSCNQEKLKKVLIAGRAVIKRFYGISGADKEDILLQVAYQFEMDEARFPVSVYAKFCRNRVISFLGKKTAKKRMNQSIKDGKIIYYEDLSLNAMVGEDENVELESVVPSKENQYSAIEIIASVEKEAPELVPFVKAALRGEKLTRKQKLLLKEIIRKEDLLE